MSYKFSLNSPPIEDLPIIRYKGQRLLSNGNICQLLGKFKSGKSILTMDILHGLFSDDENSRLGLNIEKCPEDKKVYYFDTEMAHSDFYDRIKSIHKNLHRDTDIHNLEAFNIAEKTPSERLEEIKTQVENPYVIIIDGIVDLLVDFNDIRESRSLIQDIKNICVDKNCGILLVLHLNPSEIINMSTKGRGNLGTEIVNKSQSTFITRKLKNNTFQLEFKDGRSSDLSGESIRFKYDEKTLYKALDGNVDVLDFIKSVISEKGGASLTTIYNEVQNNIGNISKARLKYILNDMEEIYKKEGRKGKYHEKKI